MTSLARTGTDSGSTFGRTVSKEMGNTCVPSLTSPQNQTKRDGQVTDAFGQFTAADNARGSPWAEVAKHSVAREMVLPIST